MNSKTLIILFGVLVVLALFTAASEEESENSVSEELAETRLARDADAKKKRKRNNKKRKGRKGKRKGLKRNNNKRVRKQKKSGGRSTAINAECVSKISLGVRRWQELVKNFDRAYKQLKNNQDKGPSKNNKKAVFAPIAKKLISLGGGNKSALECGGKTGNAGAKQLMNLTTLIEGCSDMVNKSCNSASFPKPNMTLLDDCKMKAEEYSKEALKCFQKSKTESTALEGCKCWCDDKLTKLFDQLGDCGKASDEANKAAKGQLKACKKAFSTCKKYQDDAVDSLSACAADVSKLTQTAAALSQNSAALKETKAKVKSLTGSRRNRAIRATATTCTEVISKVKQREYLN